MFAIANGRKALWQWDLNQQLTVAGSCTEVHYLDKGSPSTLTVAVKDGKADIPNVLLQRPGRLIVYAYIIDAQDHHTKVCETFGIAPRPKPAEYVYTETEVETWNDLQSQIGDLAGLATEEKNNLVAAINEAAKSGGAGAWYVTLTPDDNGNITADKTMAEIEAAYQAGYAVYCIFLFLAIFARVPIIAPLTVHRANEQYVFCGVGKIEALVSFQFTLSKNSESGESKWTALQTEIAKKSDIPVAYILPKATANALGGVKADPATADDTQPVRINDSGKLVTAAGGADISLGIASATVGQTIKVKAVNEQGMPTAWEAADMASGSSGEVWETLTEATLEEESVPILDIGAMASTFSNLRFYFTFPIVESVETVKVRLSTTNNITTGLTYKMMDINRGNDKSETWAFIDFYPLIYNGICYVRMIQSSKVGFTEVTKQFFQYSSYDYNRIPQARYVNTNKALPAGTTITILGVRK